MFPVTQIIEITLFQAFFTFLLVCFSQQNHALNVVCAAEHIDCYALVGGVAELGKTGAVTGGGGSVAGDHDDAGGGEGGYLLAGVLAAALAGRVNHYHVGAEVA